jgi:hypothetical protein
MAQRRVEGMFPTDWDPKEGERVRLRGESDIAEPGIQQIGKRRALKMTLHGERLDPNKTYRIVRIDDQKLFVREESGNFLETHVAGTTYRARELVGPEIGPLSKDMYERIF